MRGGKIVIIKNSIKQLFRKPGKAILFFLLMAAATAMLVFGTAMFYRSGEQMKALEGMYTTVATVEQPWESVDRISTANECFSGKSRIELNYGDIIHHSDLDFPGANYIQKPENRPYYLAYMPDYNDTHPGNWSYYTYDVIEFEVTEDSDNGSSAMAVITDVPYRGTLNFDQDITDYGGDSISVYVENVVALDKGKQVFVCQHQQEGFLPLEKGKTYIGYLARTECEIHGEELMPVGAPFSSQVDAHGAPIDNGYFADGLAGSSSPRRLEEVTEDFYQSGHHGQDWLNFIEELDMRNLVHPVLAVTDWNLLPCYRDDNITFRGRMITQEELDSGAKVCMVSSAFSKKNISTLVPGKKVTLSMLCSLYGYTQYTGGYEDMNGYFELPRSLSLQNDQGELYQPFWEEEYEIVGTFDSRYGAEELCFSDMIIIPAKSVGASDENNIIYYGPMSRGLASFQIPNGTTEEFMAAITEAVPDAARLNISFDDMGYSRAKGSLEDAQRTALLLLLVGLLAAAAIIMLLLYFFVVLEKKRTAIERSMGMTKSQCRVSLMAGILIVTIAASLAGSAAAGFLLAQGDAAVQEANEKIDETGINAEGEFQRDWGLGGIYDFSGKYSPWAMMDIKGNRAVQEIIPISIWIYISISLVIWVVVYGLARILVNRNLKIDPILLLNTKA